MSHHLWLWFNIYDCDCTWVYHRSAWRRSSLIKSRLQPDSYDCKCHNLQCFTHQACYWLLDKLTFVCLACVCGKVSLRSHDSTSGCWFVEPWVRVSKGQLFDCRESNSPSLVKHTRQNRWAHAINAETECRNVCDPFW